MQSQLTFQAMNSSAGTTRINQEHRGREGDWMWGYSKCREITKLRCGKRNWNHLSAWVGRLSTSAAVAANRNWVLFAGIQSKVLLNVHPE